MSTTNPTEAIEQLKAGHRAVWDSGDYADVADRYVTPVGTVCLEQATVGPGVELLDVATGSGNVAIPAARKGARVTGLDLAPTLIDEAKARAEAEGLEVEFQVGDAEALPYEDSSYDVVASVVGVQFAPRHEVVAAELARVVRPGGQIVICSWTPSGFIGQVLKTVGPRMPKPPEGASPPPLWGDEEHVSGLFESAGVTFRYERRSTPFDHESGEAFVDYLADQYGPMLKAREHLGPKGEWEELRSELIALCDRFNEAQGAFCAQSEYLVAVGTAES